MDVLPKRLTPEVLAECVRRNNERGLNLDVVRRRWYEQGHCGCPMTHFAIAYLGADLTEHQFCMADLCYAHFGRLYVHAYVTIFDSPKSAEYYNTKNSEERIVEAREDAIACAAVFDKGDYSVRA